ncbi:hypothetical protein L1S32_06205 [Methanogenium sp. S4BF]|uniref:hypothetical protein n=1 Tax=Methanogenium sp. S4BF TaxID=1789226 RepID=UPI00241609C3|nr:hypothetical protein [Methanogenium sp. S4BF]WFN33450.1 hypothetical protein L1S32_06205 [Methanogenium sp. S4BF]
MNMIIYENPDADTVGDVSVKVASVAAFGTAAAHVMADDGLATAIAMLLSLPCGRDGSHRQNHMMS